MKFRLKPLHVFCGVLTLLSVGMVGCRPTDMVVESLMPRQIFFSREEIQTKIAKRWNFDKKVLVIFEVKIDTPVVTLLPESNRLRCAFHLLIRRPLGSNLEGRLNVLGRLKFDKASRSVVLVDTRVETLNSAGMESNDPLLRAVGSVFGGTLTDIKLYELKPEDMRYAGVTFDPVEFKVKEGGVEVELQARKKEAEQEENSTPAKLDHDN